MPVLCLYVEEKTRETRFYVRLTLSSQSDCWGLENSSVHFLLSLSLPGRFSSSLSGVFSVLIPRLSPPPCSGGVFRCVWASLLRAFAGLLCPLTFLARSSSLSFCPSLLSRLFCLSLHRFCSRPYLALVPLLVLFFLLCLFVFLLSFSFACRSISFGSK